MKQGYREKLLGGVLIMNTFIGGYAIYKMFSAYLSAREFLNNNLQGLEALLHNNELDVKLPEETK